MIRCLALLALACVLCGCGGASAAWTGLGAKLTDWERAHPRSSGSTQEGCFGVGCFGPRLTLRGESTHRFTMVSTTGKPEYRVAGYQLSMDAGTTLSEAKAQVLRLLPKDTRTTAFWTLHAPRRLDAVSGSSCALWNLQSPTLGRWLGAAANEAHDPGGRLEVLIFTIDRFAEPLLDPSNSTYATVNVGTLPRDASC